MREREALKHWLSNYCRHYTMRGMPDECEAGVNYRELAGPPQTGMILRLPCLRDHDTDIECSKRSFYSDEEIEKQAVEIEQQERVVLLCIPAAKADATEKGFGVGSAGRGEIPCPACKKGALRYTVAAVNGHMHASCTTKGCASWME